MVLVKTWCIARPRRERGLCPSHCLHFCSVASPLAPYLLLYQALRKRYHALKNQADQEEVRIRVEEQRREMQSELDRQKLEMQAEFDRKKLDLEAEFETKRRAAHADFNGKNVEVEPVAPAPAAAPTAATEGVLALSKVTCFFRFWGPSSCLSLIPAWIVYIDLD